MQLRMLRQNNISNLKVDPIFVSEFVGQNEPKDSVECTASGGEDDALEEHLLGLAMKFEPSYVGFIAPNIKRKTGRFMMCSRVDTDAIRSQVLKLPDHVFTSLGYNGKVTGDPFDDDATTAITSLNDNHEELLDGREEFRKKHGGRDDLKDVCRALTHDPMDIW